MKQTVFNFNQQAILDLTKINDEGKEIRLDATDLLILDWFIYFTPNMTSINVNGKIYYWLSYSKLQEDLPFLDFKRRTFTDKLKKLCDLEVLSFHYEKNQGSITYYGFGNNYLKLIEDTKRVATNVGGCSKNNNGVAVKTTTGLHSTQQQDSSINNNSNIDSSNNIYNINNNKEINKESLSQELNDIEQMFEEFWKEYPRKVDKKGCLTKFKRIYKVKDEFENIMKALKEQKKSKQWQDSQYIPHPKTWLNQERWKDETIIKNNNKWDGYKFNEI